MSSLKVSDVKQVARLQKEAGRCNLVKLLKWEDFDEEKDLKPGILLDYLYNAIIFAAGKGFPWPSVALAAQFSEELLFETEGKTMQEALRKLRNKCNQYQCKLNLSCLQQLVNYFFGTFFRHYRLYQFVLCEAREIDQITHNLEVHIPPDIPPLKDGIDTELWKHQRYMTELSMAEAQLQADMSAFRENMQLKNEQELEKFYEDLKFQDKEMIERANLEKLVKNAHDIQIMVASEILQKEIETAFQILDLKIQKTTTALPGSKSSRSFTKEMKTKRMSIKK
ncbi:uncharacterized protein C8orf74 homolog isoform X1 [Chiloscyllium plagiosum]|uniref:uncharacterized protein C8orf74 homolog isoform X1 n=1 Tax=Chiloscyllium plagiosum TaxID=36176 RepID=UPI001CB7C230|nr:uncharacterized protein C8orf74 homolog isoform X1 [Chiloscyllium plagiosum]